MSLLCLVFALGFVALSPSDAYALWDEATATDEMRYWYNGSTPPSTLKVSPIYSVAGSHGYADIIFGSPRYQSTSGTWRGTAWNTVPSTTSPVLIRLKSIDGGQLANGQRFMLGDTGQYLINYTNLTTPTGSSDYSETRLNGSNFHYYVSKSGNSNKTEIFPDSHGTFTAPFDVQYVFIVSNVNLSVISSAKFWYVYHDFSIMIERPEDQNEVAAINDQTDTLTENTHEQTDTLMDTTGSNGIVGPAQNQGGQIAHGISFVDQTGQFLQGAVNAFNTASADSGLQFPGLTIMGYTIIQPATVSFTGYLGSEIEGRIKDGVTLVLFLAWVMGLHTLYEKIFLGKVDVEVDEE